MQHGWLCRVEILGPTPQDAQNSGHGIRESSVRRLAVALWGNYSIEIPHSEVVQADVEASLFQVQGQHGRNACGGRDHIIAAGWMDGLAACVPTSRCSTETDRSGKLQARRCWAGLGRASHGRGRDKEGWRLPLIYRARAFAAEIGTMHHLVLAQDQRPAVVIPRRTFVACLPLTYWPFRPPPPLGSRWQGGHGAVV